MSKKNIIITILLIVIVFAIGYWFYQSRLASEIEKDEIYQILENLKQETQISFSDIEVNELKWNVKKEQAVEEVIIEGKGFKAEAVSTEIYDKIKSFFQNKEFLQDAYNSISGTIGGLTGFRKDYTVCTISIGNELIEEESPESDKRNIEVMCAKGDESINHLISEKEKTIRESFAEEYNIISSQSSVFINNETENHLRGSFNITGELKVPKSTCGTFLAAKVDGKWEVVYDGTGLMFCDDLKDYNFPEDMIEDCFKKVEVKEGDNFSITLSDTRPGEGFEWREDFDQRFIQLTGREQVLGSEGSETKEVFNFLALKPVRETAINFVYLFVPEETESSTQEEIAPEQTGEEPVLDERTLYIETEAYGVVIE